MSLVNLRIDTHLCKQLDAPAGVVIVHNIINYASRVGTKKKDVYTGFNEEKKIRKKTNHLNKIVPKRVKRTRRQKKVPEGTIG